MQNGATHDNLKIVRYHKLYESFSLKRVRIFDELHHNENCLTVLKKQKNMD